MEGRKEGEGRKGLVNVHGERKVYIDQHLGGPKKSVDLVLCLLYFDRICAKLLGYPWIQLPPTGEPPLSQSIPMSVTNDRVGTGDFQLRGVSDVPLCAWVDWE